MMSGNLPVASKGPAVTAPLDGRHLVVTGASSGIGAATLRACARAGASVAGIARRRHRLEALAEEVGAVVLPADLTADGAAQRAIGEAAERLGGLDGLVNNAGIARPSAVADGRDADWSAMYELNVLALLAATAASLPTCAPPAGATS
jgi:NADP-dependent 3-hydroxy acid dehydrogenase YdfG